MPAKSKSQLRLIYARRNQYKSKAKTPKKWKWIWEKEWGELEKGAPEKVEESIFEKYLNKLYTEEEDEFAEMKDLLRDIVSHRIADSSTISQKNTDSENRAKLKKIVDSIKGTDKEEKAKEIWDKINVGPMGSKPISSFDKF